MRAKSTRVWSLLVFLAACLPFQVVLADVAPSATLDFEFQPGFSPASPVTIMSGTLFECDQPDCSDAKPLDTSAQRQTWYEQKFSCDKNSCHAQAYGFSKYSRIEILFSDGKLRRSNVFEITELKPKYTVTIRQDDLVVKNPINALAPIYILLGLPGVAVIALVVWRIIRKR